MQRPAVATAEAVVARGGAPAAPRTLPAGAAWRRPALGGALLVALIAARLLDHTALAFAVLALLLALVVAPRLAPRARRNFLLFLPLLPLGAVLAPGAAERLMGVLPLLGNLLLAGRFAATLRRGEEPLIAHYIRLGHGGVLPPECVGYARRLTLFWAVVTALCALGNAVAPLLPPHAAAWLLAGNLAVVVVLFLGEHVLRGLCFPQYGSASPLYTLRLMAQGELGGELGGNAPAGGMRHAG